MDGSAHISNCGLYRYMLSRTWSQTNATRVLWVMLNPSTADASIDDPTIKRCIGYAKAWGYGGLFVGNLYAYRATDPAHLWDAHFNGLDIRGIENDQWLCKMAPVSNLIVAAWGGNADPQRARSVTKLLSGFQDVHCIGRTKAAQPLHPLYKSKDLQPVPYSQSSGGTKHD
jgi:hypothetical protein